MNIVSILRAHDLFNHAMRLVATDDEPDQTYMVRAARELRERGWGSFGFGAAQLWAHKSHAIGESIRNACRIELRLPPFEHIPR